MLWDIFCRVIDNYGDIGLSWRLCADLAARGEQVRLWVDDASALRWMAPGALEDQWPGIEVRAWQHSSHPDTLHALAPAQVWIETFGCDIPEAFVAHRAQALATAKATQPVWINLEYLSAEAYVERSHCLPSPVMQGPAKGWTKTFFYPGFSTKTGGLLHETGLANAWQEPSAAQRANFFVPLGVMLDPSAPGERLVSLFCYEPPLLATLLDQLADAPTPVRLLVTPGRAAQAVQALVGGNRERGALRVHYLPALSQPDFDQLLMNCDVNFVRGEDSVVRAIWAGRPFVWHIYPQHDQAHAAKLEAFLDQMQLSTAIRTLHRAWNGLLPASDTPGALLPLANNMHLPWQREVQAARARLLKMDDLGHQLVQFVQKNR